MNPLLHLAEGGYQNFALSSTDKTWLYVVLAAGVIGILVGLFLMKGVLAAEQGSEKMREIARAIQEGAEAFLSRQFKTIAIIVVPLAALIYFTGTEVVGPNGVVEMTKGANGIYRVVCFLVGSWRYLHQGC